jgi:hypothetical protein
MSNWRYKSGVTKGKLKVHYTTEKQILSLLVLYANVASLISVKSCINNKTLFLIYRIVIKGLSDLI